MTRPHILTRLVDKSVGVWEYTRYRAEANSVIRKEDFRWLGLVECPTEAEYQTEESKKEDKEEVNLVTNIVLTPENNEASSASEITPINEFEEVKNQLRNGEFEPAINYFTRLVKIRPEYHIGWLRLGRAQREYATRLYVNDTEKANDLFLESILSLTEASKHIDPNRGAQAIYERSKTYYHLGRFTNDKSFLEQAFKDAEQAWTLTTADDTSYVSWIEYLKRNIFYKE